MKDLNQELDLQILERIRAGDAAAKEEMIHKYTPLVKHIVSNYYASFLDFDDLMQEGTIGLLSAIDEYQSKYNVKFSSFAYICIIRKIYNVIKQSNGNKHRALNEGISLYSHVGHEDGRIIMELLPNEEAAIDPQDWVELQFVNEQIREVLKNHLSLLEFAVITLLLQGYSNGEIEQEIGVGGKTIDNARTRVRSKLRRILLEYGSLLSPNIPMKVRKREDLYLNVPLPAVAGD
ncbi:MAG: sigma-70 family RNA polymerase sigma factor [Firmicutes bacterium]|nr:sigma-70 family RNA polymerase sigma factor [Bacillota bacterium]